MWYTYSYKEEEIGGDGTLFISTWLPKNIYNHLDNINDLDDNLHMTIIYSKNKIKNSRDRKKVIDSVKEVCEKTNPIKCEFAEIGIMGNDEKSKVINITAHGGAKFYSDLVENIEKKLNKKLKLDYDFLPHVTTNIKDNNKTVNIDNLIKFKWDIKEITVQFGDEKSKKYRFKLGE